MAAPKTYVTEAGQRASAAGKAGAARGKGGEPSIKVIAKNRTASHDFFIDETFEAGLVLTGTEVRSLRERNCQITDAFVLIRNGEAWLHGVHILPFSHGTIFNANPDRKRKLLLHKRQIEYLNSKVTQQGAAVIALQMYFDEHNRVKLEIGLARGKKTFDKRADMAKRDADREIRRALKERSRG
ncbi:MAG: SsrA-binding protein SmpB [Coriobacteriia bacterium]|nr:SsrA-binding protein SmpB [Coriobacteriia bacterium]MBS5477251.1 SsrA-binding protein SmpB [Coriobacteriia bacterium]